MVIIRQGSFLVKGEGIIVLAREKVRAHGHGAKKDDFSTNIGPFDLVLAVMCRVK